jgi:hypothetical protein
MAKSADAADLKSAGRKAVGVQVPLWAPSKQKLTLKPLDLNLVWGGIHIPHSEARGKVSYLDMQHCVFLSAIDTRYWFH